MMVAMLIVLAPASRGPSTRAIAGALGVFEHACACGMAPGKCGCPACERIERERLHHGPRPELESNCEREGAAIPGSALPPCVLPGGIALDVPFVSERASRPPPASLHLADIDGPPTPPPRV